MSIDVASERKMWSLNCQFGVGKTHRCDGTIEVWSGLRLVRVDPCPCHCHSSMRSR